MNTNTPITDAAAMPIDRIDTIASRPCNVVHEDVCRQLERELAAKTAEFDRLNESLAKNKRLFSNSLADGIIDSQLKRIKQLEDDLSLANQKMDKMKKEYP